MKTRLLIPFILALTLAGCKTATEKATDINTSIGVQTGIIATGCAIASKFIKVTL